MSLLHSGSTASDSKLYPEDVFSTYLYTGNGSTQTINNGIDLAGKGGLVWFKRRDSATNHILFDTTRGEKSTLATNTTGVAVTLSSIDGYDLSEFNNNGFSLGMPYDVNINTVASFSSWTFRKASKFFDIVTYTGDGVAGRQIHHNLGCEVGMIIVKKTSAAQGWYVYYKDANGKYLQLNSTNANGNDTGTLFGNDTIQVAPTSAVFTLGSLTLTNGNGSTYVAYLFAHDPSADGIIQCGSFTTDASGNATVNLGWEPQYVLIKPSSTVGGWWVYDTARGIVTGGNDNRLRLDTSDAEYIGDEIDISSRGFYCKNSGANATHIYLAIRRPNKVPTSGTEVFAPVAYTATNSRNRLVNTGLLTDLVITDVRGNASIFGPLVADRLRGDAYMGVGSTNVETVTAGGFETPTQGVGNSFSAMNGYGIGNVTYPNLRLNYYIDPHITYAFRRAPGFFDIVCYTGTGVARTVNHNLGVVPELMIVKQRSASTYDWLVYNKTTGATKYLSLNGASIAATNSIPWNSTEPTNTEFSVGLYNSVSSVTYVAYLFATLAGVSKVGSYTGNGSTQTISCGFSTGARFILIKRTDSDGDWYVWDTARGVVAANDPHLSLNTTVAEVTTDDSVDPDSSGFIVNQNTATNINVSGGTYIFLAIA